MKIAWIIVFCALLIWTIGSLIFYYETRDQWTLDYDIKNGWGITVRRNF